MGNGRVILSKERLELTVERLCQQLIEEFDNFDNTCLVAIQPRGVEFADRLIRRLREDCGGADIKYGKLDITFYRDDFRRRDKPLEASYTQINFLVEGQDVILVDDVLYTGRTIQAAMTALNHYGRPRSVELLVLVDRRFNRHLPIQPTFTGITVDAVDEAYVKVDWPEEQVLLFANKTEVSGS